MDISPLNYQSAKEGPLTLRLSWMFWITAAMVAVISAGMLLIYVWWLSRKLPAVIDDQGVTRRDGRRFLGSDVTATKGTEARQAAIHVRAAIIHFGKQKIYVIPHNLTPRQPLVKRIEAIFGSFPKPRPLHVC